MIDVIPCGHRLTVKPHVLEKKTASGIIITEDIRNNERGAVDRGTVVAVGPTCWQQFDGTQWCQPGDEIVYAKFAGKMIKDKDTDEAVIVLNDEDVVAVLKQKE